METKNYYTHAEPDGQRVRDFEKSLIAKGFKKSSNLEPAEGEYVITDVEDWVPNGVPSYGATFLVGDKRISEQLGANRN